MINDSFKSSAGRNLGKLVEGYKSSDIGKGIATPGLNIPSGTQNDPFINHDSIIAFTNNSGNYWFKTTSMASATEYYLDCDTVTDEKYVRVWLSQQNNYNQNSFSW